jgi:hypothetical protein
VTDVDIEFATDGRSDLVGQPAPEQMDDLPNGARDRAGADWRGAGATLLSAVALLRGPRARWRSQAGARLVSDRMQR